MLKVIWRTEIITDTSLGVMSFRWLVARGFKGRNRLSMAGCTRWTKHQNISTCPPHPLRGDSIWIAELLSSDPPILVTADWTTGGHMASSLWRDLPMLPGHEVHRGNLIKQIFTWIFTFPQILPSYFHVHLCNEFSIIPGTLMSVCVLQHKVQSVLDT